VHVLLTCGSPTLSVGWSKKQEVTITICVVPLRDYCYINFRCSSYPMVWLNYWTVRHLELWRWLVMIDWDEVGIFEEWRVENRWWWVRGGVSVITCRAWRKNLRNPSISIPTLCVISLQNHIIILCTYAESIKIIPKLPSEQKRAFDLSNENIFHW
jgi:hypothetical protein